MAISLGDSESIAVGASDDFTIAHDGTDTTIQNDTGDLIIDVNDSTGLFKLQNEGTDVLTVTQSVINFLVGQTNPVLTLGPSTVLLRNNLTCIGNQTIDGRDVSADGAKLDSIKKRTFGNTSAILINTTNPVTIFEGGIDDPSVDALQTMTARFYMNVSNTYASDILNRSYYLRKYLVSKNRSGVSLGTATYSSAPSTYNAWYYVSGDKTDIIVPNRGKMATSTTGTNSAVVYGSYYDSTNDRTYFRISKFPDASSVYNNVTVYYSADAFTGTGVYVVNNNSFNVRYFNALAKVGSVSTQQALDISIEDSFGRSDTASKFKIEIDFISSIQYLTINIYDLMGNTEVSP